MSVPKDNQSQSKDQKTTGSQGAKKSEFEEMLKNPEFVKMMEEKSREQAQKVIENDKTLRKLNNCKSYVVLSGARIHLGGEKFDKKTGVVPINPSTGEPERWDDKFYLTFSNNNFTKEVEVKEQELFEKFKDSVDDEFILIYKPIDAIEWGKSVFSFEIKQILTFAEYEEISYLEKQKEFKEILLSLSDEEIKKIRVS